MRRIIFIAEDGVFRRGRRHEAVRELRIGNVINGFREQLREVKIVAQRRSVQVIFLQPAQPFAVRTIRHQADHIILLRPADERERAVEQIVGTFKFANGIGRRMNDDAAERFYFRQFAVGFRRRKMCLPITATDIEKFRRPCFFAVGCLGEFAPDCAAMTRTHRALIDRAIFIQQFCRIQPHFATRRTGDGNYRNVRRVLAEVENEVAIRECA